MLEDVDKSRKKKGEFANLKKRRQKSKQRQGQKILAIPREKSLALVLFGRLRAGKDPKSRASEEALLLLFFGGENRKKSSAWG